LFSQASTLLRYVVLARLLGPEQLGIATTLMVTGAFFDLISDTGSDRFLVQDREGGTIAVQRLVHLVFVVRGALIAAALVLLAKPIAGFYKTPAVASGLIILALSPLILGFLHLDVRRTQRDHDFRSQAIGTLVADCVSLVATVILALVTRDYTAVVYGMITRAAVVVLMSHLTARRPYSLGWDPGHGSRLSHFAAPLMLNGFLLFVITQGDRVIVGHEWGLRVLGLYSATTLLIYYPASLLAHYLHNHYIPLRPSGTASATPSGGRRFFLPWR
jgi:O-antigen/teichoic acid export membrane protein